MNHSTPSRAEVDALMKAKAESAVQTRPTTNCAERSRANIPASRIDCERSPSLPWNIRPTWRSERSPRSRRAQRCSLPQSFDLPMRWVMAASPKCSRCSDRGSLRAFAPTYKERIAGLRRDGRFRDASNPHTVLTRFASEGMVSLESLQDRVRRKGPLARGRPAWRSPHHLRAGTWRLVHGCRPSGICSAQDRTPRRAA